MTVAVFRKKVLAIRCMPSAVVRYIASIAETLTPEAREDIVNEMQRGEGQAAKIVENGIARISSIVRKIKKRRRTLSEQAERKTHTLPQF